SNSLCGSDVENFTGKIVYNPDGSAYIIEGSDGSDVESEVGSIIPLHSEGSIVERAGPQVSSVGNNSSSSSSTATTTLTSAIPQVVSAFHISRSSTSALQGIYSALYGGSGAAGGFPAASLLQENLKVPEVPIMHSYRVYTLKDKKNKRADVECGFSADADRKNFDANMDGKENDSCTLTVPVKPILMCFICKLSFGFAKSFVAHGMAEHNLSLDDEENELLQQKNTSAIIQGVGKEKEPLLSFLEPRNRAPQPLLPTSLAGLAANLNQLSAVAAAAAASSGSASGSTTASANSSLHQQFQQKLEAAQQRLIAAAAQAAAAAALRQGQQSSLTSSSLTNTISTTAATCNESPRPSSNESLNLVLPKNYDGNNDSGDNELRFANRMTPLSNSGEQDNSLTPELADLANLEKIAKAAAAAIQQECELPNTACNTQTQSQSPLGYALSSTSPKSPGSSVGVVMATTSSPLTLLPTDRCIQSIVSSPSPYVCAQHPDGKTNGVECPKCEMILGSSRSLGGHMTMMHSRNSCKTLKCPKCNWHYKYQETLEIHMKEKHPENEMNCIYCLTNQPHPRLARGETYTCGYKPYRCEVCNYSTTTKGNLSIHMQSDKHINNVQELQNGNIPAEHLLQSQALAVAAAAAANKTPNTTPAPSGSNASSPGVPSSASVSGAVADKSSPVGVSVTAPSQTATAPQPKPKATWRCDVCNYETNVARNLRIHMTSEKHTHNMMVLQQNVKHMQQLNALQQAGILGGQDPMFQFHPGLFAALAGSTQPGNGNIPGAESLQPEAALADMAYNHALLMMASQHQQQRAMAAMMQQQQQSAQQQQKAAIAAAAAALGGVSAAAAAAALSAFGPGTNIPGGQPIVDLEHPDPSLRFDSVPYDENCRLFQCCVCTTYTCDTIEALSQHIQIDRTRLREDEVLMAVGGSYICKLCSYKTNLKANFQLHCKTDKHLQRLQQVNHIKEGGQRTEWKLKYVNVSNPIQVRCNLCDYYTNSIHKLQLHTSNPRHEASSRVFLHLQLTETLMKTNSINSSGEQKNGYYYYCALCQHSTRSMISLVHHIHSIKHLQSENLRQLKLQQSSAQKTIDEEIRELFQVKEYSLADKIVFSDDDMIAASQQQILDEMSGQSPASIPSTSTPSSTPTIDSNVVSDTSMLKQALLEQQMQSTASSGPAHKSDTSQETTNTCPFCSYSNSSEVKLQMHVLSQHSKQMQTKKVQSQLLCPLCQEAFDQRSKLELHLMEIHNVTKEGVQRLMLIVDQAGDLMSGLVRKDDQKCDDNDDCSSTGGNDNIDGKSDCSGDSSSREDFDQQAAKFLKLGGGVPAAVSDRHVYKYRCNQCSLAFKTMEKLQLHSQYHLIRAATQCVLCGRSFRSVEALQKHVETAHQDMTEEELDVYRQSLANNPLLLSGRNGGGILDPSTTELLKKESNRLDELNEADDEAMDLVMNCAQGNRSSTSPPVMNEMSENTNLDEAMETESELKNSATATASSGEGATSLEDYLNSQSVAEDSYNDPSRKYKCHRCKVAFTRQSYLTSHNKTLLHRKGEKLSYPMEKYLDPNRPYKCDICKESFTQKNILLVHYNSVSHLHKLKQAMKENANVNDANVVQTNVSMTVPTSTVNEVTTSNGNSASLANTNTNNINDLEKKPFRCNICKVAYNLGSTLDIHIRSVLHQTRASKLHDLAISGQIDLSQPLIERPDNQSESPTSTASNNPTSTSPSKADAKANSPSPSSTPKSVTEIAFPAGLSLAEQQLQQQLQQQAAALNLAAGQQLLLGTAGASGTGLYPCQRCGAIFTSQEANLQHSQICCFFGPPSLSRELFKSQQTTKEHQQSQDLSIRSVTKYYNAPVCRMKPPVYKHLLETWGFEIAMQFNEYHQKRRKPEEKKEENSDKSAETELEKNDESEKRRFNLPEINRSKCDICHKEFSSIWVLKAHKEEIHKQIVALEIVEEFAEEYRKEYERRIQNNGSDEENMGSTSEPVMTTSNTPVTTLDGQPVNAANLSNQTSTSSATMSAAAAGVTTTASNSSSNTQPDMNAASQMAAQLQFSQLLMSMGLAGMGMPMGMNVPFAAAMGLHPPMLPLMMAPHLDPVMAAFNHQAAAGLVNPGSATPTPTPPAIGSDQNFFAAQQKLLQQQQQQLTAAQQQKRARTRITDDQLKILRQYFDINNSPTEEQLQEMSEKSGLPLKVIKHWFRNTLFKERQRNKDSPYNFNNPPSTFLNLEEYEKTGEAKVISIDEALKEVKKENVKDDEMKSKQSENASTVVVEMQVKQEQRDSFCDAKSAKSEYDFTSSDDDCGAVKKEEKHPETPVKKIQEATHEQPAQIQSQRDSFDYAKSFTMSPHSESSVSSISTNDTSSQSGQQSQQLFASLPAFAASLNPLGANPLQMALDAAHRSQVVSAVASTSNPNTTSSQSNSNNSAPAPGKRANRTRFTDYQIKVLQEFFETNAYPKDDDLEYLSKLLNLSPRVIVVWFQNARQKARKVYENQPPVTPEEDTNPGKFQRTPGLNYQCKKCMQVFQRYYELIKHQKSACFKDENPLAVQIKAAQEARQQQSASPGAASGCASNSSAPGSTSEKTSQPSQQNGAFRCEKCSLVFPRFDLWREHQLVHLMNPNLFPSYPPTSPFGILQYEAQQNPSITASATTPQPQQQSVTQPNPAQSPVSQPNSAIKRKIPEDEDSLDSHSCAGSQSGATGEQPRDKRLRTTILPEQLDYLYQKYQIESNPSRKMLENIAKEVGLKKRVVQVWFQNTRARERKGQFRAHQQVIHKRCPFCRALFKARSALESHLATRHADQYTKGDINIDALPDGDPNDDTSPIEEMKNALTPEMLQNQMKHIYI
ncbi:Zinc finger homeobox protein 4-like protein, partial [Leptotrombidium deliense]